MHPHNIVSPPTAQSVQPAEYKSRWGYHVCSYETYLQLKYLNAIYWESRRLEKAARRYFRKCPHNRVHRTYKRDSQGRRCGVEATRPASAPRSPKIASDSLKWVVFQLAIARHPFPSPGDAELGQVAIRDIKQIHNFFHSLGGRLPYNGE